MIESCTPLISKGFQRYLTNIVFFTLFQNYNGVQNQGASLSLGYQTQFATTSVPPKLTSLTFNGVSICSNVNVATTTAATTTTAAKTTTTTAKTTTTTTAKTTTTTAKTTTPTSGG
jgi:hypothetical protein